MRKTNRRNFLREGATAAAAAVAGATALGAQTQKAPAKAAAPAKDAGAPMAATPPTKTAGYEKWAKKAGKTTNMYNPRVAYGPLLFISGAAYHEKADIRTHTKNVLDQIEASLKDAGSSMDKVLKVNVYLTDMKDFDGMNEVYKGRFGDAPPVRTTIQAVALPGDNAIVEIDVIAYV
jgi:enamine deaminase RidA (YjgF/YER057c/UK114 family)